VKRFFEKGKKTEKKKNGKRNKTNREK